jgi:hypothetical protein
MQGEMEITPACYSHFTNSLMGLANGRLAVVLEVSDIVTAIPSTRNVTFILITTFREVIA